MNRDYLRARGGFPYRGPLVGDGIETRDAKGNAALRGLRQAISGSSALARLLSAYAKKTSYAKQRTQVDALLTAWAGAFTMPSTRNRTMAEGFTLVYRVPGLSMRGGLNGATARQQVLMARQRQLVLWIAKLERLNGGPFVPVRNNGVTLGNGNDTARAQKSLSFGGQCIRSLPVPPRWTSDRL